MPFMPRVVCGGLVLARASRHARHAELKSLGQAHGAARFRAVQAWRATRRLPRWVALVDADNELPIDLENVLATDTLVELIKGREQATLVELFPGPDQLCVRGPEGRFVHELIVPFVRSVERGASSVEGPAHKSTLHPPRSAPHAPRSFRPGSEWLYAKLYTGPATVDQV